MSSTPKYAIVLIHSGWHVPASYAKLADALAQAGHELHTPRLPSMNESRPPSADLYTDSAFIRARVEELVRAGRRVVVLMHSYGGMVGTNALCGLGLAEQDPDRGSSGDGGGIAHLVYISAFAVPEGGSMVGVVKDFGHEDLLPLAFDFADDGTVLNRDPRQLLVGEGADAAEVDAYLASLVRWNGKCMYQEATRCAWREIPVAYVYTTKDMTVPLDYQKSMVAKMEAEGREVRTFELATGHCPNLTMTKELVDAINAVMAS